MITSPRTTDSLPVAIIGAGPVGLAAAAHLAVRGLPFVVFERDEVSSVAGSLLLDEASETATAGARRPA